MQLHQVVVFEHDGRLAALLRPMAEARGWLLREPRQAGPCLRLLERSRPGVLVLRIGRDLDSEFALLNEATRTCPDTAVVVVTDLDHPQLVGLAWDLGAAYVVAPPLGRDMLLDLVSARLDGLSGGPP